LVKPDEEEIDEFYSEMNGIKDNVFSLLQTYQTTFKNDQKKDIKKKIVNDAREIKNNYTNVMGKF
jgi:hypothetical protein